MFLSLTPNPCLEKTLFVPDFAANQTFRVAPGNIRENFGGKGINAARVCARFGIAATAIAPLGPNLRAHLGRLVQDEAVQVRAVEVEAPTRTCHNIVSAAGSTELLEAGWPLSVAEGTKLLEAWRDELPRCELAHIGGSYPLSDDPAWTYHATILCSLARAVSKRVLYDGKGEAFRRAVFSKTPPWGIKPNQIEASELLHRTLDCPADERAAVRELRQRGVELVLLSCGERGCWVGYENEIAWLAAPKVEAVSGVGSGDSLCGAFAAQLLDTGDVWQAARWGVAAGSANAARLEAASVSPNEVAPLVPQVRHELGELRLMS